MTLEERYRWAIETPSDISGHVEAMAHWAYGCKHITEFGVRDGVSTTAWLYAKPDHLICYDITVPDCLEELHGIAVDNGTKFLFYQGDTAAVEISDTDLLFIDTKHSGEQLTWEISRNHEKVRKLMIFHHTESFAWQDESGNGYGLKRALMEFLLQNREWRILQDYKHCNGLTILGRSPKI